MPFNNTFYKEKLKDMRPKSAYMVIGEEFERLNKEIERLKEQVDTLIYADEKADYTEKTWNNTGSIVKEDN